MFPVDSSKILNAAFFILLGVECVRNLVIREAVREIGRLQIIAEGIAFIFLKIGKVWIYLFPYKQDRLNMKDLVVYKSEKLSSKFKIGLAQE